MYPCHLLHTGCLLSSSSRGGVMLMRRWMNHGVSISQLHHSHAVRVSTAAFTSTVCYHQQQPPAPSSTIRKKITRRKVKRIVRRVSTEDPVGSADARMDEQLGTNFRVELGMSASPPSAAAVPEEEELTALSAGRAPEEPLSNVWVEEIVEFADEVGQPSSDTADGEEDRVNTGTRKGLSSSVVGALEGNAFHPHGSEALFADGLDSPLNLRLATLLRQAGKAFRSIYVSFPLKRTSIDFVVEFRDIETNVMLSCRLSEVRQLYFEWASKFRCATIVLFLPTLHHPSATLLQHAILNGTPPRNARSTPPAPGNGPLNDDADHVLLSIAKVKEMLAPQLGDTASSENEMGLTIKQLVIAVMNASSKTWRQFVYAPQSSMPQDLMIAAFEYRPSAQTSMAATLNRELLLSQLSSAARTLLFYGGQTGALGATFNAGEPADEFTSLSTAVTAVSGSRAAPSPHWRLVFVSSPGSTVVVPPPMQDLITGQFVEALTLATQKVIYIIGTGNACLAFHQLPTARKGKRAISIVLQDIESQLGLQRPHRVTLTAVLTQALESFSRVTWMGLMAMESGQLRAPQPPSSFYRLVRRTVVREEVPPQLEDAFGARRSSPGPSSAQTVAGRRDGGQKESEGDGVAAAAAPSPAVVASVDAYVSRIVNDEERLAREQEVRSRLQRCRGYLVHVHTASVTAARRSDNPFSKQNGIVDAWVQTWPSLAGTSSPPVTKHLRPRPHSSSSFASDATVLAADEVLPADFPTKPDSHPDPSQRACNGILIAWDVKRVILFLRQSKRMRDFLMNGGRIWCCQYAQYLLRGFDHHNLVSMVHTYGTYADPSKPSPPTPLSPVGKLKTILDVQLQLAVYGRQLCSIEKRMDGLLATSEMEMNGLRIVPQAFVSRMASQLAVQRESLENAVQDRVMTFTKHMDAEVRKKINLRSPQDISTIIYGGAMCRLLGTRFVPVRPKRYPVSSLFPHAVARVMMPKDAAQAVSLAKIYTDPESLLGPSSMGKSASTDFPFTKREVATAIQNVQLCAHTHLLPSQEGAHTLMDNTAVVVVMCKATMGGMLERFALYCPTTAKVKRKVPPPPSGEESDRAEGGPVEMRCRVAVDDIIPPLTPQGNEVMLTVAQVKRGIRTHAPLLALRDQLRKRGEGKATRAIQSVLILTDATHERLEVLVDTGIVAAIQETVLGTTDSKEATNSLFAAPVERVVFADLTRSVPPPPRTRGGDSFEADFSELSSRPSSVTLSAKETWDALTSCHLEVVSMRDLMASLAACCASLMGTGRDVFHTSHPLPSYVRRGIHGQEKASTSGMLWIVTPPNLHPILQRFLKGRAMSSSADAIDRVTVFLAPYGSSNIDLSFFKSLQQLRFTEKKLQLFEEEALFRAVLPENRDRIHGEFCHCTTATGRLSSQSPNLQNIPREEDLRRLFVSRFGTRDGVMIEADYSQLEVVVLAALSGDSRMTEEIHSKVDFHCLRVSLMLKEPYKSVVHKVKVLKDPQYVQLRQQAKTFSFQRQYGAGVATISSTTGLTEAEVEALIQAEERHYQGLGVFYRLVEGTVNAGNERLLRLRQLDGRLPVHLRRLMLLNTPKNFFIVPTGSKFNLRHDRKSSPKLKNYPVQGLAGEIVQVMSGILVRHFYRRRNYNHKAFLVNTVHDCVWIDAHKDVAEEVTRDVADIMGRTQQFLAEIWPDVSFGVPFNAAIQQGPSLGQLSE